jgi:chemotaxis protein MotB
VIKQEGLGKDSPKVEVSVDSEGLLISLTDSAGFAMFTSASPLPQPQTVKLLTEVGKKLRDLKGSLVLRGHTDSRPFKAGASDNWRLSSSRAQMAFYMLVRGGLDEKRLERVEGYADRRPKNTRNPAAAENRRIEILLRPDARP